MSLAVWPSSGRSIVWLTAHHRGQRDSERGIIWIEPRDSGSYLNRLVIRRSEHVHSDRDAQGKQRYFFLPQLDCAAELTMAPFPL